MFMHKEWKRSLSALATSPAPIRFRTFGNESLFFSGPVSPLPNIHVELELKKDPFDTGASLAAVIGHVNPHSLSMYDRFMDRVQWVTYLKQHDFEEIPLADPSLQHIVCGAYTLPKDLTSRVRAFYDGPYMNR